MKLIIDGFKVWMEFNQGKGEDLKEKKLIYEKEQGLKKYKDQLKAIDFIMD